ncbi:HET-domain-containing protein, partial [Acephala macrosclerotiorum]
LPTRVIHVGSEDTNPVLRISHGEPARYACLSRPWCDRPNLVAKEASLESHTKSLPFETLPQIFKDAILVTRALGISFLWIDALCIIQASLEDWAQEAEMMCDVFRNSYITIAAGAATDSSSGFLIPSP